MGKSHRLPAIARGERDRGRSVRFSDRKGKRKLRELSFPVKTELFRQTRGEREAGKATLAARAAITIGDDSD